MLPYPSIDPVAVQWGPLKIHWYGLMYAVAFLGAWLLARLRAGQAWTLHQINDLIFYSALGVILGGRFGYMLFYDFPNFIKAPWIFFEFWNGGMSFHGGLLGVLVALWLFGRTLNKSFFEMTDFTAPLVPLGLACGRLGNFINGELWGRVTSVSWGMIFPTGGTLPRHPSQLYELLLEGVILFIALWWYSAKPKPRMAVSGLFALLYGAFRFTVEFFREPDPQLGFIAFDWLTMGQLLSLPLVVVGVVLLSLAYMPIARTNRKS